MAEESLVGANWALFFPESQRQAVAEGAGHECPLYKHPKMSVPTAGMDVSDGS